MVKKSWWKFSVLACIGCCALPFIVGMVGGVVAVSTDWFICGGILLFGVFVWYLLKRQSAKQNGECCSVDCSCKQDA